MQIVYIGNNLHEMSNPVFWGKIRKRFQNVVCYKVYPDCRALTRVPTLFYWWDCSTLTAWQTKANICANSTDPDETAHYGPSHQDIHCLTFRSWCTTFTLLTATGVPEWRSLFQKLRVEKVIPVSTIGFFLYVGLIRLLFNMMFYEYWGSPYNYQASSADAIQMSQNVFFFLFFGFFLGGFFFFNLTLVNTIWHSLLFLLKDLKHPCGRVVSTPDFGSRGPGFKSHWRQISTHDFTALHYTETFHYDPYIVSYGLNSVERDENTKHFKRLIILLIG